MKINLLSLYKLYNKINYIIYKINKILSSVKRYKDIYIYIYCREWVALLNLQANIDDLYIINNQFLLIISLYRH